MQELNPKKFKEIRNKVIPSPLRPIFRNKAQANIYFLSQRKFKGEKRNQLIRRFKIATFITTILVGGYFLSN